MLFNVHFVLSLGIWLYVWLSINMSVLPPVGERCERYSPHPASRVDGQPPVVVP